MRLRVPTWHPPGYRWLAARGRLPGLRTVGDLVYEGVLAPVFGAWNARRARRHAAAQRTDQHA